MLLTKKSQPAHPASVKSRGEKAGVVLLIGAAFAFANCGEAPNNQRDGDAGSGGDSAGTGGTAGASGGMGGGAGGSGGSADDVGASDGDVHDDADANADEASGSDIPGDAADHTDGNLDGLASNDIVGDAAHDTDGSDAACSSTMLPAGFYCHSLPDATCGDCLYFHSNGETVCNCLTGTAKADCQALLTCLSPTFF